MILEEEIEIGKKEVMTPRIKINISHSAVQSVINTRVVPGKDQYDSLVKQYFERQEDGNETVLVFKEKALKELGRSRTYCLNGLSFQEIIDGPDVQEDLDTTDHTINVNEASKKLNTAFQNVGLTDPDVIIATIIAMMQSDDYQDVRATIKANLAHMGLGGINKNVPVALSTQSPTINLTVKSNESILLSSTFNGELQSGTEIGFGSKDDTCTLQHTFEIKKTENAVVSIVPHEHFLVCPLYNEEDCLKKYDNYKFEKHETLERTASIQNTIVFTKENIEGKVFNVIHVFDQVADFSIIIDKNAKKELADAGLGHCFTEGFTADKLTDQDKKKLKQFIVNKVGPNQLAREARGFAGKDGSLEIIADLRDVAQKNIAEHWIRSIKPELFKTDTPNIARKLLKGQALTFYEEVARQVITEPYIDLSFVEFLAQILEKNEGNIIQTAQQRMQQADDGKGHGHAGRFFNTFPVYPDLQFAKIIEDDLSVIASKYSVDSFVPESCPFQYMSAETMGPLIEAIKDSYPEIKNITTADNGHKTISMPYSEILKIEKISQKKELNYQFETEVQHQFEELDPTLRTELNKIYARTCLRAFEVMIDPNTHQLKEGIVQVLKNYFPDYDTWVGEKGSLDSALLFAYITDMMPAFGKDLSTNVDTQLFYANYTVGFTRFRVDREKLSLDQLKRECEEILKDDLNTKHSKKKPVSNDSSTMVLCLQQMINQAKVDANSCALNIEKYHHYDKTLTTRFGRLWSYRRVQLPAFKLAVQASVDAKGQKDLFSEAVIREIVNNATDNLGFIGRNFGESARKRSDAREVIREATPRVLNQLIKELEKKRDDNNANINLIIRIFLNQDGRRLKDISKESTPELYQAIEDFKKNPENKPNMYDRLFGTAKYTAFANAKRLIKREENKPIEGSDARIIEGLRKGEGHEEPTEHQGLIYKVNQVKGGDESIEDIKNKFNKVKVYLMSVDKIPEEAELKNINTPLLIKVTQDREEYFHHYNGKEMTSLDFMADDVKKKCNKLFDKNNETVTISREKYLEIFNPVTQIPTNDNIKCGK